MSDPAGFSEAPSHYTKGPRETIDEIRDILGDEVFVGFCTGNALKYASRSGHKVRLPWWTRLPGMKRWRLTRLADAVAQDERKAAWYIRMAAHVRGRGPDPRTSREGFTPYARRP